MSLVAFHIVDGEVEAPSGVPESLRQVAVDAYNGIRSGGSGPPQARVEEMISCCLDLLSRSLAGDEDVPCLYSDDDSEAEKVTDLVTQRDDNGFHFAKHLQEGASVSASQMIAAYALHKADAAARHLQAKEYAAAIDALALAAQASADYGFHWGFYDYPEMLKFDGHANARKNRKLVARDETMNYVLTLWHASLADGQRPSQMGFAKAVKDDVMAFARERGWTMIPNNAVRTISEWVAKEVKRGKGG